MLRLVIIITAVFMTVPALGSLNGEWTGWGIWSFDGSGVNCNMTLRFSENENQLVRHGGYFECNVVGMETYPVTWDWKNNDLLYADEVVGKYDGVNFELTEVANENTKVFTKMEVSGNTMSYEEKWIQDDGTLIYEIYGNFKRE